MPAAAYAAKSGDPVLFTARDTLPGADARGDPRARPPAHLRARPAERRLRGRRGAARAARHGHAHRRGRRAAAPRSRSRASRTARFGWGIVDPGHGFVFASPAAPGRRRRGGAAVGQRHLRAAAADRARTARFRASVADYLLDVKPGYSSDPVRGVYNHGWIVGDAQAVDVAAQATIDGLLEIAPVPAKSP